MKKQGYTLTEALIALGIVGVISALVMPLVNNYKPDEQKVMYLKTYDSIVEAVNEVVNTSGLYNASTVTSGVNGGDYVYNTSKYPLLDTYSNKKINGVDCGSGVEAFFKIMQEMFKGKAYGTDGNQFVVDNKLFTVQPQNSAGNAVTGHVLKGQGTSADLNYKITVDMDSTNASTEFDADKPEIVPDTFVFYVSASGAVTPADQYGQMYVDTRSNWKKMKKSEAGEKAKDFKLRKPNTTTPAEGIPDNTISMSNLPHERKVTLDENAKEALGSEGTISK